MKRRNQSLTQIPNCICPIICAKIFIECNWYCIVYKSDIWDWQVWQEKYRKQNGHNTIGATTFWLQKHVDKFQLTQKLIWNLFGEISLGTQYWKSPPLARIFMQLNFLSYSLIPWLRDLSKCNHFDGGSARKTTYDQKSNGHNRVKLEQISV